MADFFTFMPNFVSESLNKYWQGLLIALIIFIGVGGAALGAISIRQSIYAPYEYFDSENGGTDNIAGAGTFLGDRTDTDSDGLTDSDELAFYKTSPYLPDSDSDGINDGEEVRNGTDPNCPEGKDCLSAAETAARPLPEQDAVEPPVLGGPGIEELRAALREAGLSEDYLASLSDQDILAAYNEIAGQSTKKSDKANIQSLESLTPTEIRQLLLDNGVPLETIKDISDEDLLKVYKETFDQLNPASN